MIDILSLNRYVWSQSYKLTDQIKKILSGNDFIKFIKSIILFTKIFIIIIKQIE